MNDSATKFATTLDELHCDIYARYRATVERAQADAREQIRLVQLARRYGQGALTSLRREIGAAATAGAVLLGLIHRK